MNISNIADMLRADPSLAGDIPAFLKRVNERNIERVVKTREIIAEETITESLADTMGGPAAEADVKAALALLAAEPLLEEARKRHEAECAAICAKCADEAAKA